jgi:hypothetical protein
MTGAEHYAVAEQLLQTSEDAYEWQAYAAQAQVHATLAVAAALMDANRKPEPEPAPTDTSWIEMDDPAGRYFAP